MILAAAAGLGSCSAVRHCKAPEVDFPAAIAGGAAADSLAIADMEWWQFYGDSTLCNIIRHTLANNKDMLAAAARVERMRQLYRIGKADRLPSVSGTAYADHETNDYAGEEPSRDPEFGAKATVSWELDLWGNLRWAKRKGGAEYLASVEDRRAMQMTLVAEVAAAYFRLMALDIFILLRTTRQSGFSPMSSEMLFSMTSILRSRSGISAAVEAYSTFACWKTVSEVRPPSKRNCAW